MSPLDRFRFLLADSNLSAAKRVLVVQTGSPDLLVRAIDLIRTTLPAAALTVLLQRNMTDRVPIRDGVEYLENVGGKRALVEGLRARRFDAAFMLYSNHAGFWKLKVLPFLIGARHVLAINENMGWFPISLRDLHRLANHLRWRAGRSGAERRSTVDLAQAVLRAGARPALIGWLVAYEKLASFRSGASWKRDHRDQD